MEHKIAGAVTFVPDNFGSGHLVDDNGAYIGNVQWKGNGPEIARRWNAHERMLEALQLVEATMPTRSGGAEVLAEVRAAIRAAKES